MHLLRHSSRSSAILRARACSVLKRFSSSLNLSSSSALGPFSPPPERDTPPPSFLPSRSALTMGECAFEEEEEEEAQGAADADADALSED